MATVKSLRQEARQLGLRGYSRLRKADLVEMIVGYRQLCASNPKLAVMMRRKNAELPMMPTHFKGESAQIDLEEWLAGDRR